jgi:hypothetical protein
MVAVMALNRINEIEIIRKSISLPIREPDAKNIILINGSFGIGKTFLVNQLEDEIISKKIADAVIKYDRTEDIFCIPDLVKAIALSFQASEDSDKQIIWTECFYNQDRFLKLMTYLKDNNEDLYNELLKKLKLISEAEFYIFNKKKDDEISDLNLDAEINELLDNKGDRRLVINTGDVLAESIIVDLMNYYYPFNSKTSTFENHINPEPKKIVFLFDNIERINWSLWNWIIGSLIPYCTEKKFSDFISYDISNSVQSANVSDYFDFRFIVSCRENLEIKKNITGLSSISERYTNITLQPFSNDET